MMSSSSYSKGATTHKYESPSLIGHDLSFNYGKLKGSVEVLLILQWRIVVFRFTLNKISGMYLVRFTTNIYCKLIISLVHLVKILYFWSFSVSRNLWKIANSKVTHRIGFLFTFTSFKLFIEWRSKS